MITDKQQLLGDLKSMLHSSSKGSFWKTALFYTGISVIERLIGSADGKEKEIYESQNLPAWAPPAWVFAPAWILNNLVMLYGTNRLKEAPDSLPHKKALLALQSLIWADYATFNYVNFKQRSPVLGALWTQADMIFALTSLILASRADKKIALSFLPLTLWTTYASALAWYLALYNPDHLLRTEAPLELEKAPQSGHLFIESAIR
jgi:benzodiazapine receptor